MVWPRAIGCSRGRGGTVGAGTGRVCPRAVVRRCTAAVLRCRGWAWQQRVDAPALAALLRMLGARGEWAAVAEALRTAEATLGLAPTADMCAEAGQGGLSYMAATDG